MRLHWYYLCAGPTGQWQFPTSKSGYEVRVGGHPDWSRTPAGDMGSICKGGKRLTRCLDSSSESPVSHRVLVLGRHWSANG